jgi:peptidoglycan LD-endopeptidase LytH
MQTLLTEILKKHRGNFHPVIPFNIEEDKIINLDFTANNVSLQAINLADTNQFTWHINNLLTNAAYGIGGYNEDRVLYKRSRLFDGQQDRSIHLGIDIWGNVNTPVYAPLDGKIHSFAFNNQFGDYGATIIAEHQLEGHTFHTLYGHLSLANITNLSKGDRITKGDLIAHFGNADENGNWPPHLHFQLIEYMQNKNGDYPGVCAISEKESYLNNCPDPDIILNMLQYAT